MMPRAVILSRLYAQNVLLVGKPTFTDRDGVEFLVSPPASC